MNKLIIDDIKYEKIASQEYQRHLFEETEVISYLNNFVEIRKSVYNVIGYDFEIEKRFTKNLDER